MSSSTEERRMSSQRTVRREVTTSSSTAADRSHAVPVQKLDFSLLDHEFGASQMKFDEEMSRMEQEMEKLRHDFFTTDAAPQPSIMPPEFARPHMQPLSMPHMPPPEMTEFGDDGGSSSYKRTVTSSKRTVTTSSTGGEQQVSSESSSKTESSGGGGGDVPITSGGGGPGAATVSLLDSPDDIWKDFMTRNPSSPLIQEDRDGKSLRLRFDVHDYKPEEIEVKTVDNMLEVSAKHQEASEGKSEAREFTRKMMLPSEVDPEILRSSLSKDGILTVKAPLALEGPGPHVTSPPP